jgi:hypothetical protein
MACASCRSFCSTRAAPERADAAASCFYACAVARTLRALCAEPPFAPLRLRCGGCGCRLEDLAAFALQRCTSCTLLALRLVFMRLWAEADAAALLLAALAPEPARVER